MIPQTTLFSWENQIGALGDLARLQLVLENLPAEEFMRTLEAERGRGRNEYPVRAMWNATIAMVVLGHPRYADLIRELRRNVQLRWMCGFEDIGSVPGADNLSRFVSKLEAHSEDIMDIFIKQSKRLYGILPDFGECLALDSKWIWSAANRRSERKNPDGRSETDANVPSACMGLRARRRTAARTARISASLLKRIRGYSRRSIGKATNGNGSMQPERR
jgi:hypothetical protein